MVQDKGRGSQKAGGRKRPSVRVTPPRNAGRGNGLRGLHGGDQRWSVWLTFGVTGGRNQSIVPSNPHEIKAVKVNPRGSPLGYGQL